MNQRPLTNIYTLPIGCDAEFKAEHQFFNLTCLLTITGFSSFIVINAIFEIDFTLTLIKLFVVLTSAIFYYFSRIKNDYTWSSVLYFLMILLSLLFIGVNNGGVTGGIAPIYTAILALMLFVMSGLKRILLLAVWVLSISYLFIFEYYRPNLITQYSNIQQEYIDLFLSYFSGIVIVAFVVANVKKLYKKELLTAEELIKKYRASGFELKEIMAEKMTLLSLREREICKLLIHGKSNKEIADELYIEIGTVKAHINNIYSKLSTNNRTETIDLMTKI